MRKFGYNNSSLSKWKKENLSPEEIKETSLRKKVSASNLPEVPHNKGKSTKKVISMETHQKALDELKQKNNDIESLEQTINDLYQKMETDAKKESLKAEHNHAIQEYITEKELAYQEAQEWHEKYKDALEEVSKLKDQIVKDDYEIQNLKFHLEKALSQLDEIKKESDPLRKLLSIYLRREQDVS